VVICALCDAPYYLYYYYYYCRYFTAGWWCFCHVKARAMSHSLGASSFTQCYPSQTIVHFLSVLFQGVQPPEATRHFLLRSCFFRVFSWPMGTVPRAPTIIGITIIIIIIVITKIC